MRGFQGGGVNSWFWVEEWKWEFFVDGYKVEGVTVDVPAYML